MSLRNAFHLRPLTAILAAAMLVVALACGGDAATPTTKPTATSKPTATAAPTATSVAPTPTLLPGETAAPTATATAVPEATALPDEFEDWVGYLMSHPGYKEEWGTPQYGGIYKTADPRAATRFQITGGYGAYSRWQYAQYNGLLVYDPWLPLGSPSKCDLCETFEISADGLHYTFKLREGVTFHAEGWGQDKGAPAESFGAEMTCEDVKVSMEWWANPPEETYPSSRRLMQTHLEHLKDVSCPDGPDGYTAVLNFTHVRNATLGWITSGIPIRHKEYVEWQDMAYPGIQSTAKDEGYMINHGTGPFIPTFANSQLVMKTKTNPNYFRTGAPFVDGIEFYVIQDYNTKFAALVTGRVHQAGHGSSGITKAQVQQVLDGYLDDIELHIVRYNHISHFELNPHIPPFDNWNVRWAVHIFLDRQDWNQFMTVTAKDGAVVNMADPSFWLHGDVANNGWGVPQEEYLTYPGYDPATKDADIAEANRLLDEAFGAGVRPKTDQYVIQTLSRREISVWGFDQFHKHLGWDFNVKYVDTYGDIQYECLYTIRAEANPHTNTQCYIEDPADAFWGAHTVWGANPPCAKEGYKDTGTETKEEANARTNAMIEELDTTLDQDRRHVLARELNLYMVNERTTAPGVGTMNVAWPNRREVKGVYYFNLGTYGQQGLHERIWLAQ
ncbi:MAG: ABC transporter substrate-binding protein [Chloroflexota bacterium]